LGRYYAATRPKGVIMARTIRKVANTARKGKPHAKTAARTAQIQRWQMLGAAARKGKGRAAKSIHHQQTAKARKSFVGSYANATKWGISKLILPVGTGSLVAIGKNSLPGYNQWQVARGLSRKRASKGATKARRRT
jgi:hypothetical protein